MTTIVGSTGEIIGRPATVPAPSEAVASVRIDPTTFVTTPEPNTTTSAPAAETTLPLAAVVSTSLPETAREFDLGDSYWNGCKIGTAVSIGAQGENARCVQLRLNDILENGDRLTPDGNFGPISEQAVKDFQQQARLPVDGVVGPVTAEALSIWDSNAEDVSDIRFFDNCRGYHAVGVYDIPVGDPRYRADRDVDHDGLYCEPYG